MFSKRLTFISTLFFVATQAADSTTVSVVCVAGQCSQGYTNISLGATLQSSSHPQIILLPSSYSNNVSPQLLHDALTTSGAVVNYQPGFSNSSSSSSSSVSFPLNVAVQPGLISYVSSHYSGQPSFHPIPSPSNNTSNNSTSAISLNANSLALSDRTWAALTSSSNTRLVIWSSIPDIAQLPGSFSTSGLSFLDAQASSCSPACSSGGVCSSSTGTCTCAPGFTGSSCETCASGFFGPSCLPCPANCTTCADGITGSGICLSPTVANEPSSCNCVNGVCDGSGSTCKCNPGWGNAPNGTQCSVCADGFFQDSNGNCEICQVGCSKCSSPDGACLQCAPGFSGDAQDNRKCDAVPPAGSTACQDGSFSNGGSCTQCDPACKTCTGAGSGACILCATGSFKLNGQCVPAGSDGVCQGTSMVGDGTKGECDACPAKCTACSIPNFSPFSSASEAQCTACLPGFVLSSGKCVSQCPNGQFLSSDNKTCQPCSSTCSTCSGSADFCLTCSASGQLASSGKCVTSCPSNTFSQSSSSSACLPCHSDCATCSGSSFSQCSSCPSSRPVLNSGRCLPTCSQNQFFDGNGGCSSCDGSCGSCSGPGPNNCLSCSASDQVLQGGKCVKASCASGSSVVPSLGLCLSDLVATPSKDQAPLPTISGISTPTAPSSGKGLQWWQILLMVLGCFFIFFFILGCYRRRMRKRRAEKTKQFALKRGIDKSQVGWWHALKEFVARKRRGIRLEGDRDSLGARSSAERSRRIEAELRRHDMEMGRLGASSTPPSRPASRLSSIRTHERTTQENIDTHQQQHIRRSSWLPEGYDDRSTVSGRSLPSVYSKPTHRPTTPSPPAYAESSGHRTVPLPRTSMKNVDLDDLIDHYRTTDVVTSKEPSTTLIDLGGGRASGSGSGSESGRYTPAQEYMHDVTTFHVAQADSLAQQHQHLQRTLSPNPTPYSYWITPVRTGNSATTTSTTGGNLNPFRREV